MSADKPVSLEEARSVPLLGWNIRCNRCGSYGAEWISGGRPDWGALAACLTHAAEYRAEIHRHEDRMRELRVINYEQVNHG